VACVADCERVAMLLRYFELRGVAGDRACSASSEELAGKEPEKHATLWKVG